MSSVIKCRKAIFCGSVYWIKLFILCCVIILFWISWILAFKHPVTHKPAHPQMYKPQSWIQHGTTLKHINVVHNYVFKKSVFVGLGSALLRNVNMQLLITAPLKKTAYKKGIFFIYTKSWLFDAQQTHFHWSNGCIDLSSSFISEFYCFLLCEGTNRQAFDYTKQLAIIATAIWKTKPKGTNLCRLFI